VTPARSFSAFATVFAVVFAVIYVIAVEWNYALFTYHAAIGEFGPGVQKPKDGPAMYWYGWLATSGLAALSAGLLAYLLPEGAARRLWPGWTWVVPVCVLITFCYLLRNFFLR
jgi:hypothetical protein